MLIPFAIAENTKLTDFKFNLGAGDADNLESKVNSPFGVQCYSIKDLIKNGVLMPNHLKIDVDGIELSILEEGRRVTSRSIN